jgi:Amt family ammonium transporter
VILTNARQYDYVELTRDVAVPDDGMVDEGLSTHSLEAHGADMGTQHEKNQESIDSGNQLAEWAHRA